MSRLIDKEKLAEKHPAFRKKNRLEWLAGHGSISSFNREKQVLER